MSSREFEPMDPLIERLQTWQPFYMTVAAVCATLTGLLFVALSLNVDLIKRAENAERMWLARQTFSEFLLVLMVALIFLIPGLGSVGLGASLFCLGGAWTLSTSNVLLQNFRQRKMGVNLFLRAYGLSLAGTIGVIIIALCMFLGIAGALYGLVFMLAALLASASRNAWSLLVEIRAGETSTQAK
jgi:hypothetical protein